MVDTKKPVTPSGAMAAAAKRKGVVEFIGEVKQELKLIDWTGKDELQFYTKIVAGAMFLFGMSIYFMDLIIQGMLHLIGFLAK